MTGKRPYWPEVPEQASRYRGRPSRLGDRHKQDRLRRIAQAYLAYLAEGDRPGVYRHLMSRFHGTTEKQIKALVRAARADEWLAKEAEHGARGAAAGPRLLAYEEDARRKTGREETNQQ